MPVTFEAYAVLLGKVRNALFSFLSNARIGSSCKQYNYYQIQAFFY